VSEAAVTATGGLDVAVVRRFVHVGFESFRTCYAKGLKSDPSLHGVINTSFVVSPAGAVGSASTSSSLGNAAVESCVRAAFKTLTFPKADTNTAVVYPLVLTPS
jgi:hypothetical protein